MTATARTQVATLTPLQVGVGVQSAAESVAMGTQAVVDHLGQSPNWCLLKVDMTNAFNTVDRTALI